MEHVARIDEISKMYILVGESERKILFGKHGRIGRIILKLILKEMHS